MNDEISFFSIQHLSFIIHLPLATLKKGILRIIDLGSVD